MTTTASTAVQCPTCGNKGRKVQPLTLRSLLKVEAVGRVADTEHRFCDSKDCAVVYFADGQTFTKSDLKVPVGAKEITGERPLCYCFGHSIASIKQEFRTKGRSDALTDIRQKMESPGCHCETSNPSGSCCLGSVTKGTQIAQKELGMTELEVTPARSAGRGESIAKFGAVVSAIMASSCCWLPLLLLAIGVSGAGVAATLDAYRPLFITVTFGFLGAAFYFTYRSKKAATAAADSCCAPEGADTKSCCPPKGKTGRFSVVAFNKVMLWGVTVLAVTFLFLPSYTGLLLSWRSDRGAVTQGDPLVRQTSIAVDGMHCEACAVLVEKSVEDVPHVVDVKVNYETKQAIVSTQACCPFPKQEVLAAMQQAGYLGNIVQME